MNNFSENRLLKMGLESGPGRAPVEAAKPRIDTPQKLEAAKRKLRGEAVKQRQKIEPVRSAKNLREAAVDRHLDKIDTKKFAEMTRDGSVMVDVAGKKEVELVSAFSADQVDKVVDYAVKNEKDLKAFVDGLATQITTRKFGIDQLSDKSRTALIKALSKDAAGSKVLLEKLLATDKSADLTIKTAEESFRSNPGLIENLIRIIGTKKDLLQKLSPTSLATLLNVVKLKDARIFDKLDSTKKSSLLFTQLNPELKAEVFNKLMAEGLAKLDRVALENMVIFAYENPKQLNVLTSALAKSPKIIGKIGLAGCIKLLVETFGKKGQEKLQKLLLANISGANKLSIYKIKSIDVRIRMAVWESFSIDMKKKTQKPKNIDQLRKENQALMKKESAAFLKKCADKNYRKCAEKKIKTVEGFSIVGRDVKFNIAGVGRSFKKSARFFRELAKPKYDSPLKVKLACYKELLRIIKADRSYFLKGGRYNWHKIAKNKDYAASNAALEASIAKYAELIANLDKGNQAPDKRTLSGRVTVTPAPAPAKPAKAPKKPKAAPEALKKAEIFKRLVAKLQKVPGSENYKFEIRKEWIAVFNKKDGQSSLLIEANVKNPDEMNCNFSRLKESFKYTKPEEVIKKLIAIEKFALRLAQEAVAKLEKAKGGDKYKFTALSNGTIEIKKDNQNIGSIYVKDDGVMQLTAYKKAGFAAESKNPEDIIKAIQEEEKKLTPQQVHEKILANLKEQGIRIILPARAKLPLLKPMENHDGLQRPVFDIQHAIMDGKDLGNLTKVLKKKGQIIKNYIEKTLKLKGVKIEITINVTKRFQGKETKISKKITWDQNVKENGGFGKVGADLLLGKKGETVYAAPPAVPGEPGAPAGAPVRRPKARPTAAPKAPEKVYESELDAKITTIREVQILANQLSEQVANELKSALGISVSRKITIDTTIDPSTKCYRINVDGRKSKYVLGVFAFKVQKPKPGFRRSFFIRRENEGAGASYSTGNEQGLKDQLTMMVRSTPNQQQVTPEVQTAALQKLEAAGLKIMMPKGSEKIFPLSIEKLRSLLSFTYSVQKTVTEGYNIHGIVRNLKIAGKKLQKFMETFPAMKPGKIKLQFSVKGGTLTWDPEASHSVGGFGVITRDMKWGSKKELIKKIHDIKKIQLSPEQYKIFLKQNKVRETELRRENETIENHERYRRNWALLADKKFMIDKSVGNLDGNQMLANWERFEGHHRVNTVLGKHPFKVPEHLQARTAMNLICGEGLGITNLNDRIDFEDVFDFMKKGFLSGRINSIIPNDLLKSHKKFLAKAAELERSKKDPELLNAMFKDVLNPAFELMEEISRLKFWNVSKSERRTMDEYDSFEGQRFKDPMEIAKDSIPADQMHIVKGLQKLLGYSEYKGGFKKYWRRFLGWLGGAKSKFYLSDMDGKSFKVDEGMFRRYFNPKAALFMILEKRGMYSIVDGKKRLNGPAILKEVNNMLKRGYIMRALNKITPKGKKPTKEQYVKAVDQIEKGLSNYQISSFAAIKGLEGKHKNAFQLGFINIQVERMQNQVRKGLDAKIDNAMRLKGKDPSKVSEGERVILRKLIRGGIKERVIAEIHSHLAFGGYMHFDSSGKFQGAGVGKEIRLSDGTSLLIGGGVSRRGPGLALGLTVRVKKLDGGEINFTTAMTLQGVAAGFRGTHDVGKGVKVSWFAGAALSWSSMLNLGVAAGAGLDWDQAFINLSLKRSQRKIEQKTKWGKTIRQWASMSPARKMQTLQKLPQWPTLKLMMARFPKHLTQKNLIRIYNQHFEELRSKITKGAENLVPFIPVGISTGAIVAGTLALGPKGAILGAIAGLKFRLGTVAVFIPTPGEKQRILRIASANRIDAKVIEKLFKDVEKGKYVEKFSETTGEVFYRPGSKLGKGIRIGKKHLVNLNQLGSLATGIKEHNKALKEAELQLVKTSDGRIELKIHNLFNKNNVADKDMELHIDPTLRKLGVIIEGGRIFIEGNINDLIITRERFMFSHQKGKGKSSVRDVITIRQKSSFQGRQRVTREWLMKYEGSFVQVLMGHRNFSVQRGAGHGKHLNILGTGKRTKSLKEWLSRDDIKALYAHRPDVFKKGGEKLAYTAEKLKGMRKDIGRMHEALGVLSQKEFKGNKLRPDFYQVIRDLYNDPKFYKKFKQIIGDPDKIVALIKEYCDNGTIKPKLNVREFTVAENYLRNLWFTTAYSAEGNVNRLHKYKISWKLITRLWRSGMGSLRILQHLDADEISKKSKGKISLTDAKNIVKAVQEYKNRPLKKWQLRRRNRKLLRRIDLLKQWTRKSYLAEFRSAINRIDWGKKKPDPVRLVDMFMRDMYSGLIKALKNRKDPLDFRTGVKISTIPRGSTLLSGSRIKKKRKILRAMSNTLSYESTKKGTGQVHDYGFLKGFEKTYALDSVNPDEQNIARILLEIASPLPKNDMDLLKSAFAMKMLGLGSMRFLMSDEGYNSMIEIVKNPDKHKPLKGKSLKAMKEFRKLLEKIRTAQHAGKPFTATRKGLIITIDMTKGTTIVAGAFSKCANASFYVYEGGRASIKKKPSTVIGAYTESVQVARSSTKIASICFSLAGGFTHKFTEKPKGEKIAGHGGAQNPPEGDKVTGHGGASGVGAGGHRTQGGAAHHGVGTRNH